MKKRYFAAVDIGGTKITVSIASKKGFLCKVLQPTKKKGNNKTTPKQVDYIIEYLCNNIKIKKSQLSKIGISSCSPFGEKNNSKTIIAPNLCGALNKNIPNDWKYIPIQEELSKKYKKVIIGNDGVTSVVAERLFGNLKNFNDIVYVTWSTGIGTGAYVTGVDAFTGKQSVFLITGKKGNAPHGGHIYLEESGPKCGCGQIGDFESLVSGSALEKIYKKPTKELFEDYKKNNKKAKKIIQNAAKTFAKGLISINALFDTKAFVLGGSLMKNKSILLPLIKKEFYKGFKPLTRDVVITTSAIQDYIGDLAALSLVMPKDWIKEWQKKKPWKNAPEQITLD